MGKPPLQRFDQAVTLFHDLIFRVEYVLPLPALCPFQLLNLLLDLMLFVQGDSLPCLGDERP